MCIKPLWKQKFDVLKDYIKSNSEIYIDMREISIPENLRDKFYQYFDDIRNTFVEDFFASLPIEVDTLCTNYNQAEKELIDCLKLDRVELPIDLMSFLHNPREGMVRWIYNRLFEVIQEKIALEDFEHMAENDIFSTTAEMYRLGYEAWAVFTFITSLEPDEAYFVELDKEDNPIVGELKEVAFGRQFHHNTKRLPEFIIHSKKLDSYVAVKMPVAREVDTYYPEYKISKKIIKKLTGDTSSVLESRIMFVSMLKNLEKIPVYIDILERQIQNPDLIIEFLAEEELADKYKISQVQSRTGFMKPKLGSTIVVMNPGEKPVSESSIEGIDIFLVGFDKEKFEPVIDKLLVGKDG
ncbi:MAG: hypothetical protein JW787_16610 [Sedimentisphaerales bacterium]|nr:hypothetical protein [Sedimentisphaerales bacterium]